MSCDKGIEAHDWRKGRAQLEVTAEMSDLMDMWTDGVQGRHGSTGAYSFYEYSYCARCGKVLL